MEGSVRIARVETTYTAQWENSCAVPVIPTAGAGLYGRGQRLEGSLVGESVRIARVETTFMAQWENSCAEQLCHARYFLPVASRRSVQVRDSSSRCPVPSSPTPAFGMTRPKEACALHGGDDLHGTARRVPEDGQL